MNLSTYVYDVLDEVSKLQKQQTDASPEQAKQGYEVLRNLESVNSLLQLSCERFKASDKEQRAEIDKVARDIEIINEKIDTCKARCKDYVKMIASLKELDKKIIDQAVERRAQIDQRFKEALEDIKKTEKSELEPAEYERLKTENQEMKDKISQAIEDFKTKEAEYRQKIEGLRSEFQEVQASIGKEMEDIQKQTVEYQRLKTERDIAVATMDTVRQRINIYHEKVPKFYQMVEFKEKQYEKYTADIKEILVKFKRSAIEKQTNEEAVKRSNELFFELHQEVRL